MVVYNRTCTTKYTALYYILLKKEIYRYMDNLDQFKSLILLTFSRLAINPAPFGSI